VFVSGVDWSGDPGNPLKPGSSSRLTLAMATVRQDDLTELVSGLDQIRSSLGWAGSTPFHFMDSDDRSRRAFFSGMVRLPVMGHVRVVDKQAWYETVPRPRPSDLLDLALLELIAGAPVHLVSGQVIQVDRPRSESTLVRESRAFIRRALADIGVRPGPDLRPVPDRRPDAQLIQVADMIAGVVAAWGLEDRRLRDFGHGLRMI